MISFIIEGLVWLFIGLTGLCIIASVCLLVIVVTSVIVTVSYIVLRKLFEFLSDLVDRAFQ